MATKKRVHVKCTIQNAKSPTPLYDSLDIAEDESVLLDWFRGRMEHEYQLFGEVTIHRPKKDPKGKWGLGPKICDPVLHLTNGETIFVRYDESVEVVPGGAASGARVVARDHLPLLALGGRALGGQIDSAGNVKAGDGIGGSAYGKNMCGSAGEGIGGNARPLAKNAIAQAGAAVGGRLVLKTPDAHYPK